MGNKRNFRFKLNLPSSWPVRKRKEKKNVRVSWELLGTLYTLPKSVLVSLGAELIFSTAQAWGGCEVL